MDSYEKDSYFVAVKLFLRDGDKLLLIHDIYGAWDLPGGRIRKQDFDTSLEDIAERKVREEIGPNVEYELGAPNNVFFRVERQEVGLDNKTVRIFAVGYDAKYLGGEIETGEHIEKYEWVDVKDFEPEEYLKGGWLKGVQDYLKIVRAGE